MVNPLSKQQITDLGKHLYNLNAAEPHLAALERAGADVEELRNRHEHIKQTLTELHKTYGPKQS